MSGRLEVGASQIASMTLKKSFLTIFEGSRLQLSGTTSRLGGNLFKKNEYRRKMSTVRKKISNISEVPRSKI